MNWGPVFIGITMVWICVGIWGFLKAFGENRP